MSVSLTGTDKYQVELRDLGSTLYINSLELTLESYIKMRK